MHVGMALNFQNLHDKLDDREVYEKELAFGVEAEGLGFESLWCVEHHFTDYILCPNVLQQLTYFAAKTSTIELGSAVVVLPWHNPVRVAEEVTVLDHMSNGRVVLGIGRGLGRVEFEGLGVNMGESRERFVEYSEMLLNSLDTGFVEYDGKHLKQPRRELRPKPFKSFRGRTYAAAVSPESVEIMSKLGVGIMIVPQKPWEELIPELASYRARYQHYTGEKAPPTRHVGYTCCHEDADVARDMAVRYIGAYYDSVLRHYELAADHMKDIKGYEHYADMQEKVHEHGTDAATEAFLNLQIWGTPEMCYEKIVSISNRICSDSFTGVFSFGGMAWDVADANRQLFVDKVMPELKALAPIEERFTEQAAE